MPKIETKLNSQDHAKELINDSQATDFSENLFRQKLIYFSFLVTSSKYLELPYPLKGKNNSN